MFQFTAHPAVIGVTDGVQVAFAYLQTSWRRWLPAIAVMAACVLVAYAVILASIGTVDIKSLYYVDQYTNKLVWYPGGQERLWSLIRQYLAVGLVTGVLGTIAGWVFAATAICGLRNQPLTVPGVVGRGLVSLVASIVIAVVAVLTIIGIVVVTAIVAVIAPPLGAILIIAEVLAFVPVAWYVAIRLVFVNLAVFDGFGPIEAIRESWRISQRSVLRLLGWGLMAALLTFAFVIVGGIASSPFSAAGLAAVGQAASAAVTTTGSCLVIFLMAVLYESQRARVDPTLYGPPPVPAPVWGNQWPGYPGTPPAGPYPPAPGWQGGQWAPPAPTFQPPAPGPTASPGEQAFPSDKPSDGEPPAQP